MFEICLSASCCCCCCCCLCIRWTGPVYSHSRCFLFGPMSSSVVALQTALASPCPARECLAASRRSLRVCPAPAMARESEAGTVWGRKGVSSSPRWGWWSSASSLVWVHSLPGRLVPPLCGQRESRATPPPPPPKGSRVSPPGSAAGVPMEAAEVVPFRLGEAHGGRRDPEDGERERETEREVVRDEWSGARERRGEARSAGKRGRGEFLGSLPAFPACLKGLLLLLLLG